MKKTVYLQVAQWDYLNVKKYEARPLGFKLEDALEDDRGAIRSLFGNSAKVIQEWDHLGPLLGDMWFIQEEDGTLKLAKIPKVSGVSETPPTNARST